MKVKVSRMDSKATDSDSPKQDLVPDCESHSSENTNLPSNALPKPFAKANLQLSHVLGYHGKSLDECESERELLEAFRGSISWYNILHRERTHLRSALSVSTTLGGGKNAVRQSRDDIILDHAIQRNYSVREPYPIGARAFQSLRVFMDFGEYMTKERNHSFMDDLESFFYVLSWVCSIYSGPGNRCTTLPTALVRWVDIWGETALNQRCWMYYPGWGMRSFLPITDYFDQGPVQILLNTLFGLFCECYHPCGFKEVEEFQAEETYNLIIDAVQHAIQALEEESLDQPSATEALRSLNKRSCYSEETEEGTSTKRLRSV